MVDEPIGHAIAGAVGNDLVRGVIATDALIGTFASLDDQSLRQNICFLYHISAGHWDVPDRRDGFGECGPGRGSSSPWCRNNH